MAGLADKVGENYDYEHVIGLTLKISFATNYHPAWPIYCRSNLSQWELKRITRKKYLLHSVVTLHLNNIYLIQ